ncbi:hypothetical protein [Micromonospora sp. NPDC005172]
MEFRDADGGRFEADTVTAAEVILELEVSPGPEPCSVTIIA